MRNATAFAVSALAASAAIAVIGLGTASATTLCKTGGSPELNCGSGKGEINALLDNIFGTSTNLIFTTSITNVTCTHSTLTIDPETSTGTPVTGTVTGLTFAETCKTSGGTHCKPIKVLNLPYHASIDDAALIVTDPVGAGVTIECGFILNCTFTTKNAQLTFTNGSPTTLVAASIKLERSGGLCPETAEFHATYSISQPSGFTIK